MNCEPTFRNTVHICGIGDSAAQVIATAVLAASGTASRQNVPDFSGTEIEITVNGGILPDDDDKILLFHEYGIAVPGSSRHGYSLDRVSVPNKIILDAPTDGIVDIMILIL